jgi:hypothetical protein
MRETKRLQYLESQVEYWRQKYYDLLAQCKEDNK